MSDENRVRGAVRASDSTRQPQQIARDDLVTLLTTYSRMTATPEETDAMLLRVYGPDRIPATASRARSQEGRDCETCGRRLPSQRVRWCSRRCRYSKTPPTTEQIRAEMVEALDRLIEETAE